MKRMILRTLCLAAVLCLLAPYALATGALPYDCYNYDYWNNILYTPAPYVPDGNISGNYWTSTEFSETEAIRMNLGTVERYGGHYYSSIKAKREDKKTIKVYSLNGVNYQMKVRPFLAF